MHIIVFVPVKVQEENTMHRSAPVVKYCSCYGYHISCHPHVLRVLNMRLTANVVPINLRLTLWMCIIYSMNTEECSRQY